MKARRFDFYPDDWLAGTATLDVEEVGVYITAIAAIYSHGGAIPKSELQRLCKRMGCHGNAYNRIVKKLFRLGKLIGNGADLGNKRCENELETSRKRIAKAEEMARKRWDENNKNNYVEPPQALHDSSAPRARLPSPSPSPSPERKKDTPPTPRKKRGVSLEGFDDWWKEYPHKVGKGAAEKAWPKALALVDGAELAAGVRRYIDAKPPDREWVGPAVWLNQKRWLDQPAANGGTEYVNGRSPSGPDAPPPTIEEYEELFADVERRKMGVAR